MSIKMNISETFRRKRPVLSFEIFPPKKDSYLKDIDETLKILCQLKPDFISVTFGTGGSLNHNKTIELAGKIKEEYGVEPLVHLTCLSYSRREIDEFAKRLEDNGLKNVLALRGHRNPDLLAREDFLHASDLAAYLKTRGDFCIAGACYPECHPESENREAELVNLKKKTEAGAQFLISQLFFENSMFYSFVEDCREHGITVPVTAGIMPVINAAQIERMVSLCGASLPDKFKRIINKFDGHKEALFDAGMAYALSQVIDLLANDVDGIHLYTMNNPAVARRICGGIKNMYF